MSSYSMRGILYHIILSHIMSYHIVLHYGDPGADGVQSGPAGSISYYVLLYRIMLCCSI